VSEQRAHACHDSAGAARYARVPLAELSRRYRSDVVRALGIGSGQRVVEVGFGPRELADLAKKVGDGGVVSGVDLDGAPSATGVPGRAEEGLWGSFTLPVPASSVDRLLADRVLRQVDDATNFLAELRRVLRPGGVASLTEPDWATLVLDPIDHATNLAFTQFIATSVVGAAAYGRQLPRLAENAGFTVRDVLTVAPVVRDFETADRLLGLTTLAESVVRTGRVSRTVAGSWLAAMRSGPFLCCGTIFTTVLEA
jgi:ubiquinone/menaquinone biosynthesis C-methylase UbiE